ncbi:MAG: DnaB-like helicase C-terminal domain-containing protein [Sphingobacteriales bacterium]|nr:DnaB-like helicase C-terminal domain-containing protein [Sphingobacteriales bacterium]
MTVTHNTAFTLSIARNAAVEFGKAIAFFSLEMSAVQLVNRLISAETGIAADKLKKGTLEDYEWTQLSEKVERLAEAKIFIDDTPAINIFELRAKCRRLKMQHDIQLIVVDYLQLMSGSTGEKTRASGNREQEISMISRSLKSIAKELNVPVIALSQLSRAVETRGGDKRPMLSDLRESGSIEQDADMVIFLYRPEYYGFDQDEEGNSSRGVAEVIIAKHRNGATDTAKVRFIAQNAKFTDLDNNFGGFGTDLNPIGDIITFGSRMNDFGSTPPSSGNSTPTNNNDDIPF